MNPDQDSSNDPVIKLPRGRGLRFSGPEIFRIALTLAMLIAVVALTKPCANAVSTFVMGMDDSGRGTGMRKPKVPDTASSAPNAPYERLTPGMTEAEVRSAIERAKDKGAAASR